MKQIAALLLAGIFSVGFTACGTTQAAGYAGLNAEIVEMTYEVPGMVVKWLDPYDGLGEACFLNCSLEETNFLYADFETQDLVFLSFADFMIGDEITIDIEGVSNSYSAPTRVQLTTQRLGIG